MEGDEPRGERLAAREVLGARDALARDAPEVLGVERPLRPVGDEVGLASAAERHEPAAVGDEPHVEGADVPRDLAEHVEREDRLLDAVGAPVVPVLVRGLRPEDERVAPAVALADDHLQRLGVTDRLLAVS